jgi:large subunit ribosomal protein L25
MASTLQQARSSTAVSEVRIPAEPRTEFGKGGARRTRRAGKVPAVLYGHGQEPRHISLPAREIAAALRHDANALLELQLDGGQAELALAKDVQRDPLKQTIDHIDLILVRRGEKVSVDIPVTVVGESSSDVLVQLESATVSVEAEATNIPSEVQVDVAELQVGTTVTAADLELPQGVSLAVDSDSAVVVGLPAPTADQLEAEIAGVEAELGAGQTGEAATEAVEAPGEPTGEGDVVPGTAESSGGPSDAPSRGVDE